MNIPKILQLAQARGGSFADLFFEQTRYFDLSLRDGIVNATGIHTDSGMGVRVLHNEQTGYAYTESFSQKDMEHAARTAACIALQPAGVPPVRVDTFTSVVPAPIYPIAQPWEEASTAYLIPYLQELNDLVFQASPRVKKVTARITHTTNHIKYYNSLGITCEDLRPLAALSVQCVMEENGRIETNGCSRSFRMGAEFLTHERVKELANEVVTRTQFLFGAQQPKGGQMPVVMGSGGSGILLHEAIGHAFEADFIRKNISIFSQKMGQRICHSGITIVDSGILPQSRGAVAVDDEGVPGQRTAMVTNGVLTSFLHDRLSAQHFGVAPTGNGRRESFRFMPLPRMRATYMENGDSTEEALIASVKKGIYVDSFSNGQVQIGAGDFTFYVKSGYLIENGRLTQPIKDVNVIGNGPETLACITGVANNGAMENATWTCGKEQSVPVSCGMPSVLVSQLTVGGLV